MELKYCKLEIFLPPTHLEVVQKALQEVDAGHIGNYDSCMSVSPVTVTGVRLTDVIRISEPTVRSAANRS